MVFGSTNQEIINKRMQINAKDFGLSSRVKLEQIDETHITIVKAVKSRIIKKDALKIIQISQTIQQHKPNVKVSLSCYKNICSKSIELLENEGIEIIYLTS